MLFIFIYLVLLFIAPQLWIEPFVGVRVDLYLYPVWLGWVVMSGRAGELFRLGPQDKFFAAWVVWIGVSMAVNGFQPASGDIILNYVKWFVLYRLTVASLPTLTHVHRALLLLFLFGMVLSLEGIQHMNSAGGTGWAGQGFAWIDVAAAKAGVAGRTRWINIFDGPGVFCVIYTIALPFAMRYFGKPFGAGKRVFGAVLLAPLLLATFYTGSRGGFLATVAVFGLYMVLKFRISLTRIALIGAVLLAVLALAPKYLTSTSDAERSAQHRVDMWGEGVEMVTYNPVFGIGKGNFLGYTGKLIAHNSAIEIMGETGFSGLFLWLGIIYMAFKNLYAAYRENEDPEERSYIVALGLSVAGYILSSMFVTLEYETFYFLLALPAAVGNTLSVRPSFTKEDFWRVGTIMVAFFLGVKGFVMLYF